MSDTLLGLSAKDAVEKLIDTSSNSSDSETEISHADAVAAAAAVVVTDEYENGNLDDAKPSTAVFTPNDDGEVQIDMGIETATGWQPWRRQLVITLGPLIIFLLFIFIILFHYIFFLVMAYVKHHPHSINDNFLL